MRTAGKESNFFWLVGLGSFFFLETNENHMLQCKITVL